MKNNKTNTNLINIETLVSKLKTEDNRNLRILKFSKQLMWSIVILYSLMLIIQSFNQLNFHRTIGTACILIAFIFLAMYYKRSFMIFQNVDYGMPTLLLLKDAVNRYTFTKNKLFQKNTILFGIGISLTVIGFNLLLFNSLGFYEPIHRLLIINSVYLFLLILGGISGFLIWFKRHKPIRDNARNLIKEIES